MKPLKKNISALAIPSASAPRSRNVMEAAVKLNPGHRGDGHAITSISPRLGTGYTEVKCSCGATLKIMDRDLLLA